MTNIRFVLRQILDTAALSESACAAALGVSREVFAEMLAGQREIPESMLPLTAAVVGVNESVLTSTSRDARKADVVPAIWYKLRSSELQEADREYVLALRQLSFYEHELELVTDSRSVGWRTLFEELRRETDHQASPTEQGRIAARLFRRSTGLDSNAIGIGEALRGNIRNLGILVIESSAPESMIDGCSFYVGPSGAERPAIFANSYRTTWFRRNAILMHELAHAIFDVESTIAALDLSTGTSKDELAELRADAFAQESLVPMEVLRNIGQRQGVRWDSLSRSNFAELMAATHVEQRLLVKALLGTELINSNTASVLSSFDIVGELREFSDHALSTDEFMQSANVHDGQFKKRTTTTGPRKLRLPFRYVTAVLNAFSSQLISRGKAARMLMIDEYDFSERFAEEQAAILAE